MGESDEQSAFDPVRLSKLLAFVLRHRPDTLGLTLDPDGWVDLARLVERLTERRRLPFAVSAERIERLAMGEGSGRFEVRQGKIRARRGHTVAGTSVPEPAPPDDPPPEFLFLRVDPASLERAQALGYLSGEGGPMRLWDDEQAAAPAPGEVVVIDAARASKQGTVFAPGEDEGLHHAGSIPLRFVISLRSDFERQVSAGGVLAKGRGEAAEFALIRTLPRDEASAPPEEVEGPAEIEDARARPDRRDAPDRRREDRPPPGGVERRQGPRRQKRRRRSGRWGEAGRLELPKGKLEPGETPEQAAVREVREELGISERLVVEAALSSNHYAFRTPDGRVIFKTVHYYLLTSPDGEPRFQPRREEGIVSVEWWPGLRAIQQVAFKNLRPVLERAWTLAQSPPPRT